MCIPAFQMLAQWAYYLTQDIVWSHYMPWQANLIHLHIIQELSWVWYYIASHLSANVCY